MSSYIDVYSLPHPRQVSELQHAQYFLFLGTYIGSVDLALVLEKKNEARGTC